MEKPYYYYGTRTERPERWEILAPVLNMKEPVVTVDVETVGLKDRSLIGIGIGCSTTDALYFPVWPEISPEIPWEFLNDTRIKKIFHNAAFDLHVLAGSVDDTNIADTTVMAHLLNMPPALTELVSYLDIPVEVHGAKEVMAKFGVTVMTGLNEDIVARKCGQDCIATYRVYDKLKSEIDQVYFDIEMRVIPIMMRMSRRGILVDQDYREELEIELQKEVDFYKGLAEAEGFNPGSPQQVGYILAKRGNWLPFTRGRKSLRTDVHVLEKIQDPIAALVLNYRQNQKLLGTYVRPLENQERAYTRFHMDAITGRVSSTERNMQNIPPGRTRNLFMPDSPWFTSVDASQVELRILAYLSQDRKMLEVFDSGGNIHEATADYCQIPYKLAKSTGFCMIYGGTVQTMMDTAQIRDKAIAQGLMTRWSREYSRAWDWIKAQQNMGLSNGYITTIMGRKIKLPVEEDSEDGIKRKAVNYPIQGSAAEILKRQLILCDKEVREPMALQVHDEILFDGLVKDLPEGIDRVGPLCTPVKVKYLDRWE